MDVSVDGCQRTAQLYRGRWSVGGDEWSQYPVVDLGVEDCDSLSVGCQVIGVAARSALDEPVEAESCEVIAHLVDGVGDAEQLAHLGTEAPVGEAEGGQTHTQGAEQGHDPRISEPQCGRPPAILGEGGLCDPLKGWARKDTTLPDTFSIEQAGVDGTCFGLQFVQMHQAAVTRQIVG